MKYETRVAAVAAWLTEREIAAAFIEDTEGRRNPSLRYLTGHPEDALLFVFSSGRSVLIPWDVNLANALSVADEIIPYTDFNRVRTEAFAAIVKRERIKGQIEIGSETPVPVFKRLSAAAPGATILCREEGLDLAISNLRIVKDVDELERVERAARITDDLLHGLEELIGKDGAPTREVDIALFLERQARELGAERMSFETIAAGPGRSFGIHAFPSFGNGVFGSEGLSILDFGVLVDGYPSDVTITVAAGRLRAEQEQMIQLVQEAYELAVSQIAPGTSTRGIAAAVDAHFAKYGCVMPHSLGHGLGLEVHEAPRVSSRDDNTDILAPGMVITIEPGLYDPALGGARLENDFLITESGCRRLTNARILRIP